MTATKPTQHDDIEVVQHLQLRPRERDVKPSVWVRFGRLVSNIIRSRFGVRSVELADRFFEAKVRVLEGEARVKNAEALRILSEAAHKFTQADALLAGESRDPGVGPLTSAFLRQMRERSADVTGAIQRVDAAVKTVADKGGQVEIRIVRGTDTSLGASINPQSGVADDGGRPQLPNSLPEGEDE